MRTPAVPSLLTPGRIADKLGVSLSQVLYVLSTRRNIVPAARAGTLRLYDSTAVAAVRQELNAIQARHVRAQAMRHGYILRTASELLSADDRKEVDHGV